MPMDRSKYPPNWDEIATAKKNEAGWCCEKCNIRHLSDATMGSCLTVHHPDKDTMNPDARLEALCARCHLKGDIQLRIDEYFKDQLCLFETDGKLPPFPVGPFEEEK